MTSEEEITVQYSYITRFKTLYIGVTRCRFQKFIYNAIRLQLCVHFVPGRHAGIHASRKTRRTRGATPLSLARQVYFARFRHMKFLCTRYKMSPWPYQ